MNAVASEDSYAVEARDAEISEWLQRQGFFRPGTGIRSPRSLAAARARTQVWADWMEMEIEALGSCTVWNEMDALAAAAGLSPTEKAVLSLGAVEQCSLVETAARLGVTVHCVRVSLAAARAKCRRLPTADLPCSAHTLFYEEVQQKRRSVYRTPYHGSARRRSRRSPHR